MSGSILIVAEHAKGQLTDMTFEMLAAGRRLAEARGAPLWTALLGSAVSALAEPLSRAGGVLLVDRPELQMPFTIAAADVVRRIAELKMADVVLVGGTNLSMGIGPRVAGFLNAPFVNFITDVRPADPQPFLVSQLFGGKIMAETPLPAGRAVLCIYPGAFSADEGRSAAAPSGPGPVETPDVPVPPSPVEFLEYIEPEAGDVDITQQDVLVSVGRGIQSEDNLELAQELADVLGGAVSASRPVVDQGWLPLTRQVGKSGMSVKPRLYLALGISGAPEHVEGMKGARLIVAVNTDPDAPIFNVAHYGICADLFDVVPALTEAIRERRQAG
ncbi:MAG: electron transfer flavoprotein subunit alpha/FixB family protein [Candidatus Sumerlaeia bacterium]